MGVGTFRDDFGGSGRSINVDGPLPSDEDYAAYVKEQEGEDYVMSEEEFYKDAYDQANEDMLHVVESVARSVGLHSEREGRFDGSRVNFDKDFTGIASGDVFDVGWRSWEHDFVVAIGPSSSFEDFAMFPEDHAGFALSEHGRAPAALKADYDAVLGDFETLVRLSLLTSGIDTAVPTSGYTSSRDVVPADAPHRIEALTASVKAGVSRLSRGCADALREATVEERLDTAKALAAYDGVDVERSDLPRLLVATVDEGGHVALWNPLDDESGLNTSLTPPVELRPYLATLPLNGDGLAPIPFDARTKGWYGALQRDRVVLSPEQYVEATGKACVVAWIDEDENTAGTFTLHGEPAPAMAP